MSGRLDTFDFAVDSDVWYDENHGIVLERRPSDRSDDDYLVRFDNGTEKVVWGSDLTGPDDQ